MRALFFSVAAIWGFLTGVAAVLIGLAAAGQNVRGESVLWSAGLVALLVAIFGGLVSARAYRETASRR